MTTRIRNQQAVGSPRVVALDVLRGIAIIGTLATNIWIFSQSAIIADGKFTEAITETSLFRTIVDLVTDGKWIGLLTIMFGIGLEIQRQSALKRGQKWPGRYPWRAALLILDGLLNYLFIFEFDVLMGYGLTALAVAAVLARSEKTQKIWMWVCVTVHLLVHSAIATVFLLLNQTAEQFAESYGDDQGPPIDSYWDGVIYRATNFLSGRLEIPIMFVMGLGLFLVGARLYRAGIFEPAGGRIRRITMLLSFGVGLPIDWAIRLFGSEAFGSLSRYVTSTMVSLGVLALVASWYANRNRTGPIGSFFTVIGRTALSCYVLQNLLASILFYDWGFGLARHLTGAASEWGTLLIWALLSLALFAFAWLCLRFFGRGPLEALWQVSFKAINRTLDRRAIRRGAEHATAPSDDRSARP